MALKRKARSRVPAPRKPVSRRASPGRRRSGKRRGWGKRALYRRKAYRRLYQRNTGSWLSRAYEAGAGAAASLTSQELAGADPVIQTNRSWYAWYKKVPHMPWPVYEAASRSFAAGFCSRLGWPVHQQVWLPTEKRTAAIITVMNERETIVKVLDQLKRLPLSEVVVVVNGSTDGSFDVIRQHSSATIVHYPQPLGHDVGRAIGAKLTDAELLLFVDGDIPVSAGQFIPFIAAVDQGYDIALNDISPYIGLFAHRDEVTTVKEFLNHALGRPDLSANSLTAVPHAMTASAAREIGYANLAVPPKAQAIALSGKLKVCAPAAVNVITTNRIRLKNVGQGNPVAELIIGDHLEAIKTATETQGARLSYPDHMRNRFYCLNGGG